MLTTKWRSGEKLLPELNVCSPMTRLWVTLIDEARLGHAIASLYLYDAIFGYQTVILVWPFDPNCIEPLWWKQVKDEIYGNQAEIDHRPNVENYPHLDLRKKFEPARIHYVGTQLHTVILREVDCHAKEYDVAKNGIKMNVVPSPKDAPIQRSASLYLKIS